MPGLSPQLSKKKVDSKIVLQSSVASRTFGAVKDSELFLVFCCTSKIWGCVVPSGLDRAMYDECYLSLNELEDLKISMQ